MGKTIKVDGEDFAVVGVMPRGFTWQFWSGPRQLWVPVGYTKTDYGRGDNSFICIARLNPGVTIAEADSEMSAVASHVAQQYPKKDAGMDVLLMPVADFEMNGLKATMMAQLAAVGFVLLIACVNVANLMLARGAERQKEFAIRRALGAPGLRIDRQILTESLALGLLGGAVGLLPADWGNKLLYGVFQLADLQLPMRTFDTIPLDAHVLGFAFSSSCLASILIGLAPTISALRGDVHDPLKEGGRGSTQGGGHRVRNALVTSEVALALVVLCGAGLMIESMARLMSVDPGFDPKSVLTTRMSVPQEAIYVGPPGLPRFCQDLDEHLSAISGVVAAGAIAHLPLRGNAGRSFQVEGQRTVMYPRQMPNADYSVTCPNYFRAMGIPVV